MIKPQYIIGKELHLICAIVFKIEFFPKLIFLAFLNSIFSESLGHCD